MSSYPVNQTFLNETGRLYLKRLIFLYLILLILEGSLRRWIFPGFAREILIIRDPVAIILLFQAWRYRFLVWNTYLSFILLISLLSFFSSLLIGHGNIWVTLYGLRILILHVPLIFVIAAVLKKEDIMQLTRWMIIGSIPMAVLITIQFYSPQTAWVNRGLGGDFGGAGFSGALGYFRPPGTFSFTTGVSTFFGLAACFVLYALLKPVQGLPRWVVYLALLAVLLAIPFSISRSLFFLEGLAVLSVLVMTTQVPVVFLRFTFIALALLLLIPFLFDQQLIATGLEAFNARFESANEIEGGLSKVISERFLGGSIEAITNAGDQPFWGYGIGMGSNVGSQLLSGERTFLIAEGEWGRWIGELGPLLGLSLILMRVQLAWTLLSKAYGQIARGDYLPWILASNVVLLFAQGQWAQPNALGFAIFFTGVLMALLKPSAPGPEAADV